MFWLRKTYEERDVGKVIIKIAQIYAQYSIFAWYIKNHPSFSRQKTVLLKKITFNWTDEQGPAADLKLSDFGLADSAICKNRVEMGFIPALGMRKSECMNYIKFILKNQIAFERKMGFSLKYGW